MGGFEKRGIPVITKHEMGYFAKIDGESEKLCACQALKVDRIVMPPQPPEKDPDCPYA